MSELPCVEPGCEAPASEHPRCETGKCWFHGRPGEPEPADPAERTFAIGQTVELHKYGRWYEGTVERASPTRVQIRFRTNPSAPWKVRTIPAGRVRVPMGARERAIAESVVGVVLEDGP